jgi:hypothetical protein
MPARNEESAREGGGGGRDDDLDDAERQKLSRAGRRKERSVGGERCGDTTDAPVYT